MCAQPIGMLFSTHLIITEIGQHTGVSDRGNDGLIMLQFPFLRSAKGQGEDPAEMFLGSQAQFYDSGVRSYSLPASMTVENSFFLFPAHSDLLNTWK
jgi:hypothetical protein